MKAKEILRALIRSGKADGCINIGWKIKDVVIFIENGEIRLKKEYFYTFSPLCFVLEDCIATTIAGEKIYLYSL